MSDSERRAVSPIMMKIEYTAREAVAYIAGLTGLQIVGVLILALGVLIVVLAVDTWRQAGFDAWVGVRIAVGLALGSGGLTCVGLVGEEPEIRGRMIHVGEDVARRPRAVPKSDADSRAIVVNARKDDPRMAALAEDMRNTRSDLAQLTKVVGAMVNALSGEQQPEIAISRPIPRAPELPANEAPALPEAERPALPEPQQRALPEPRPAHLPQGRAGFPRHRWRAIVCDVLHSRSTTYEHYSKVFGLGRTRAEAVRKALIDAGIAQQSGGETSPLILAEDLEERVKAELQRLDGGFAVLCRPLQPVEAEKVPVGAKSEVEGRQGSGAA